MRTGWKPFFFSFLITLGVLLPFVWCGTLYYDTAHSSAEPAAQPQSGVPILSGSQDSGAFLIALAPWQECPAPSLAILRLDCPQAAISVCLLPPGTVVRSPGGSATLAQSYLAAGPGRAAQLLCETLALPPLSYVAATPGGWALLLGDPVLRLDTASLLTPAQRTALGLEGAVGQLSLPQAAALCAHSAGSAARRKRPEAAFGCVGEHPAAMPPAAGPAGRCHARPKFAAAHQPFGHRAFAS